MASTDADDMRWMGAALALGERGCGVTCPNPNVGCVIVAHNVVVGRGWTQPGGRPHAEAMALAHAGTKSRGATLYTTLEPCAHVSERGPACVGLILAAKPGRVVIGLRDPDPRTDGLGSTRIAAAGIAVSTGLRRAEVEQSLSGFLTRQRSGRPHLTLKLALSLDGAVSLADGQSQWITGAAARAHAHMLRARCNVIVVGHATLKRDSPRLDVRLDGLAKRSPKRAVLSRGASAPIGWTLLRTPHDVVTLPADRVLIEGGAATAASFLAADLVDTLVVYRAPILIGGGRCLGDIGLAKLGDAHGGWRRVDRRNLGSDTVETYQRTRE